MMGTGWITGRVMKISNLHYTQPHTHTEREREGGREGGREGEERV